MSGNNLFLYLFSSVYVGLLDRLYLEGSIQEYVKLLTEIKDKGYRVFRNDDGKHIVKEKE